MFWQSAGVKMKVKVRGIATAVCIHYHVSPTRVSPSAAHTSFWLMPLLLLVVQVIITTGLGFLHAPTDNPQILHFQPLSSSASLDQWCSEWKIIRHPAAHVVNLLIF